MGFNFDVDVAKPIQGAFKNLWNDITRFFEPFLTWISDIGKWALIILLVIVSIKILIVIYKIGKCLWKSGLCLKRCFRRIKKTKIRKKVSLKLRSKKIKKKRIP
uniref:UN5 n=1 Tax=Kamese virus TaxID=200402 RepID=A0A1V0QSV7_9RHAB|nr:UN5 [Kamese virus]